MVIIKEEDVIITHFGVQGMRWGVRKERYAQNREKAKNIVGIQSNRKDMNKSDLAAAEWMSKSVPDKIANTLFKNAVGSVASQLIFKGPESFKDPKEIEKLALSISRSTAKKALITEATSATTLRRYHQSGEKDLSKKQYKRNSLTPERAIRNGIRLGMVGSHVLKRYGPMSVIVLSA